MTPPAPHDGSTAARKDLRAYAPALGGVVAVAGGASNAGKTRVMEVLLRAFAAEGRSTLALKVTRTHVGLCPRGNDACGTCDSLGAPFEVVRAPERLALPKKDTGRYVAAGATETRWLLVRPDAVAEGLRAAVVDPPAGAVLVAEGNSFLECAAADVALMALWDGAELKDSARRVLPHVDAFVRRPARDGRPAVPPRDDLPCLALGEIAAFVAARLAQVAAAPRPR